MKVDTHHLVGWKQFATCRADSGNFYSPETRATLNRFYARYRLALKFEAVHAHGYSERAMRGYTAGLRLPCHTAQLNNDEATDEKVVGSGNQRPKLAVALRKSLSHAAEPVVFSLMLG